MDHAILDNQNGFHEALIVNEYQLGVQYVNHDGSQDVRRKNVHHPKCKLVLSGVLLYLRGDVQVLLNDALAQHTLAQYARDLQSDAQDLHRDALVLHSDTQDRRSDAQAL